MTKEELKKEAEEKADIYFDSLEVDNGNVSDTRFSDYDVFVAYEKGALDFAEPREKQIKLLGERCTQLLKDKGELTDKIDDLKANFDYVLEGKDLEIKELENQVKDLEKENAELKAKNKWYSEQVCNKECAEVWRNLTKAKDLLNEFMGISKASDEDFEHDYSELIGETEQFLKDIKE